MEFIEPQNPFNFGIKSIDQENPATWMPRGLFVNIDNRNIGGYDFDLLRNYQKKVSDGGLGAINLITGTRDTEKSGIFLSPPPGMNMYLRQFNTIVEILNSNDLDKAIDDGNSQNLELWVRGEKRYSVVNFSDMALGATSTITTNESIFNPHLYTITFSTSINPAGLYKYTTADSFHLKFENDLPAISNHYTRIYFAFFVWLTIASNEE